VDNLGLVGTSNLNHRSLLHDLEVDVVLKSRKSVEELASAFERDLKDCKEVTIKDWEARPLFERLLGNMLLYVRYWL
jgi:cardiolipin synthase